MGVTYRTIKKLQRLRVSRIHKLFMSLPDFDGVTLIDIGAAGGIEPRWRHLSRYLNFIGFEPDVRSRESLMKKKSACKNYVIHPFAIWSTSGAIDINFTRKPEVSSFFEPKTNFLQNFPKSDRFNRENIVNIECKTLDSLAIKAPDFIKCDIQGAELEALRGAQNTLQECLGIELEVEFTEIYKGQPLFGEISNYLSNMGFEFFDFLNLCRWERDSLSGLGQLVFGDALFLRTPDHFLQGEPTNRKLSSYLAILHLYNRYDLIAHIEENLPVSQKAYYLDFFSNSRKFRSDFRRIHQVVRLFNGLIKLRNSELKLYLIH
jgi:FkbM family methyltransferase